MLGHKAPVLELKVNEMCGLLASGDRDGSLFIWDC